MLVSLDPRFLIVGAVAMCGPQTTSASAASAHAASCLFSAFCLVTAAAAGFRSRLDAQPPVAIAAALLMPDIMLVSGVPPMLHPAAGPCRLPFVAISPVALLSTKAPAACPRAQVYLELEIQRLHSETLV